jgi:hypothetical protein
MPSPSARRPCIQLGGSSQISGTLFPETEWSTADNFPAISNTKITKLDLSFFQKNRKNEVLTYPLHIGASQNQKEGLSFRKKKAVLSFLKAFFFIKFAAPPRHPAFFIKSLLFRVVHIYSTSQHQL